MIATKHFEVGMSNYTPLTGHQVKPKPKVKKEPAIKVPQFKKLLVPAIGTLVELQIDLISNDSVTSGAPCARITFDEVKDDWVMKPIKGLGMLIFFKTLPNPFHTHLRILEVLPTQTACNVEPCNG
jgi:hypothetical protein